MEIIDQRVLYQINFLLHSKWTLMLCFTPSHAYSITACRVPQTLFGQTSGKTKTLHKHHHWQLWHCLVLTKAFWDLFFFLLFTVEFSIYMLRQDFSLLPKIACRRIPLLSGPCSFVLIMSAYDSANPVPFWSYGPALYTALFYRVLSHARTLFQKPTHLVHQTISAT